MKHLFSFLAIAASTALPALADLKLPHLFSDGMVLQRDTSARIWGWSDANAPVKITFAGQTQTTTADQNGDWHLDLKGLKTNAKGTDLTIVGGGTNKVIKDVLVGEVWLASGQSNMEWRVDRSGGAKEEIASAKDPLLRVFVSINVAEDKPQKDWKGNWKATESANTGSFTAVGYYFAKRLRAELKVPVGVIECAWGGKPVQSFVSEEALTKLPIGKSLLATKAKASAAFDHEKVKARFDAQTAKHTKDLAAWNQTKEGKKPRAPRIAIDPAKNPSQPSTIYHGMIAPLVGYGNRGAIWYQGESNANGGTAEHYEELLGCLVADWRQRWENDLSFYWVQLANYRKPTTEPGIESQWVTVQDEMRRALKSIPKSGMAVINDIGHPTNVHPMNKVDVGERLARWALVQDYDRKDVIISGPLYSGMTKKDDKIVLTFDHAAGLKTSDGKDLQRFEIAGPDGKWHWAKATIEKDQIILSHDTLKTPTKARYAWAENPQGANLVNGADLPASCFTTE